MKLTLNHVEMTTAIAQYVKRVFTGLDPNAVITVDMRAGRGENGYTAEVDISMPGDMVEPAAAPAPAPKPSLALRKPTLVASKEEQSEAQQEPTEEVVEVAETTVEEPTEVEPPFEPEEELGEEVKPAPKATIAPATEAPAATGVKRPLFAKRS